ncbi:hypothetical protein BDV19DRAFT_366089 [Aspergillus venezuelensis]
MSTSGPPDVELATLCCIFIHLTTSSTIAFASQKSIFRPIAFAFVLALAIRIQDIVVTWAGYRHIAPSFSLHPRVPSTQQTCYYGPALPTPSIGSGQ